MPAQPVPERLNADFSQRVVIVTDKLTWLPSPQAGVERRMLDRVGGEVARATSIVRYEPASQFPEHGHALGEEFLVLDGVFSDEHGDCPKGTYVRNPPGSHHSPRTKPGCLIFVKLRQMLSTEHKHVVIDTTASAWRQGDVEGHTKLSLYVGEGEQVTMERLRAGVELPEAPCSGGEEILVLSGDLGDDHGTHGPRTWVRNPAGHRRRLLSRRGATYWVKRGHLKA
ncbi:cupin domain-containing protein [Hypericibacter sp.]|uniref:cupin domain-containing protein n=1 Tax=Hypericibacter sp. TaxID=2705401 RepID=UPI003D6CE359